jgi:hypothetical protein
MALGADLCEVVDDRLPDRTGGIEEILLLAE